MTCFCDRMLNGGQIVHRNPRCPEHGDKPRGIALIAYQRVIAQEREDEAKRRAQGRRMR